MSLSVSSTPEYDINLDLDNISEVDSKVLF